MKRTAILVLLIALPLAAAAENKWGGKAVLPKPEPNQKIVQAYRTDGPIVLDGKLEESVWKNPPASGFTQSEPADGQPSTEKTDVWVAYDDKFIYIAAYCHDSEPKGIIRQLGRRDAQVDSDWFVFAVDPYYDKRTGYLFGINPSNSIMDEALSNDVTDDSSWDGIWEGKTAIVADGWTVEMKIPFNQIRFPAQDEYVWGVNFRRIIKRKNETAAYAWVPKSEPAFVSKFARLVGIRDINPGTHAEIMPYVTGRSQFRPAEPGNPFETGSRMIGNAGFDLKLGLKSNLTLDATINPDFGQVEVDPAVINLSAYETFYEEKRPFFIEGANIFNGFGRGGVYLNAQMNWPDPRFFYSRRVGRPPEGSVTQPGFAEVPGNTTILGAAKVTGQLGGWNVGLVNSLTGREYADIEQAGTRLQEEVEPFSYYGALRAQKDINQGQQGIGIMATGVMRDLRTDSLSGILNRNAFSLALDGWTFLDKKRDYVFGGWFGGTRVEGTAADILRLQNSSMHYYQRPDASYLGVDPSATSLSGWGGRFQVAKQNGSFLWVLGLGALSPGFDPNDAGFQRQGSDLVNVSGIGAYQWTKPGKLFQYAMVALGGFQCYDFGGNKTSEVLVAVTQGTLANFWQANLELDLIAPALTKTLTRGGPLARLPGGFNLNLQLDSDSRKPFVLEGIGMVTDSGRDGNSWMAQLALRWKPLSNLSLSIGPQYMFESNETQWVGQFEDALMTPTYGNRYVFGHIRQQIVSAEIRLNWTFTPALSLQAYLQPFIGVGRYDGFKELAKPREYAFNVYGRGASTVGFADGAYTVDPDGAGPAAPIAFGNPDFNMKSLRGTIVLRWEYRPGSLLYFVWTQNRADYANPGDLRLGRDMANLLTAPGDNIFMLKFSYRWGL